jgi:hypothetical protein
LYCAVDDFHAISLPFGWLGGGTSSLAPLQAHIPLVGLPFDFDSSLIDTQRTVFGSVGRQLMKQQGHTCDRSFAD